MNRYFLLLNPETLEVYLSQPLAEAPPNSVLFDPETPCSFIKPVFDQFPNPTAVVEGATPEEIAAIKTPELMLKLQNTASDLRIRAKAAAIGKTGDSSYIFSQVELYELKNKVASGQLSDPYMIELLQNEAVEFGLPYEEFCNLIQYMYNTAKGKYEIFLFMIERCRTKIQTLIENWQWETVYAAFALVDTLNSPDQAQTIMSEILAL